MADNVSVSAGTYTTTVATKEASTGVHVQKVTLAYAPQVIGFDAHDDPPTQPPVLMAGQTLALGAVPVDMVNASQDVSRVHMDRYGRVWIRSSPPTIKSQSWTFTASVTNQALISPSAGNRLCLTRLAVKVNNDTTVVPAVAVAVAASVVPAESTSSEAGVIIRGKFSAGGGEVAGNGADDIHIGEDAEKLLLTCDTPTNGKIYVEATSYLMPST